MFSIFSIPSHLHGLGKLGTAHFVTNRPSPQTYVSVHELALVPVVQVNELGRALLLSVHPGTHVLTAGLCVEVGALPVPLVSEPVPGVGVVINVVVYAMAMPLVIRPLP